MGEDDGREEMIGGIGSTWRAWRQRVRNEKRMDKVGKNRL